MHRLKTKRFLLACLAMVGIFMLTTAESCDSTPQATQQTHNDVAQRFTTFSKAESQIPVPRVTSFPRRKTLADAVSRQSLPNHPWYVYVLGQNGNIVNYFVAKSVPVNDCDYLSSTDNITNGTGNNTGDNNVVIGSPSYEGIYQSSSGCNTLTFFDLATDAEIQISTTNLSVFVTDRPLKVDAQPFKVKSTK